MAKKTLDFDKLPKFKGEEFFPETAEEAVDLIERGRKHKESWEKDMLELRQKEKDIAEREKNVNKHIREESDKRFNSEIERAQKFRKPKLPEEPKSLDFSKLDFNDSEQMKQALAFQQQQIAGLEKTLKSGFADRDEITKAKELREEIDAKLEKVKEDNPELGKAGIGLIEKEMMINNDDNPYNYLANAKDIMSTRDASVIKTEQDRLDAEAKKADEESGGAPSGSGINAIKQEKLSEKTWEELEEAMDQDAKTPVEK